MRTIRIFRLAFEICMIVSKKPIGLIVLLFIPCFAVCQNSVDSTAVIQDSIATITDSLSQRNAETDIPVKSVERYVKRLKDAGLIKYSGSSKSGGYFLSDSLVRE